LKAFFDHGYELRKDDGSFLAYEADTSGAPETWGNQLVDTSGCLDRPLTVEGELNKLAANISIGRNWAGVHYFTDYIESLRMGEQIAIGILQEQKLTYGENFSMTVPLYDGGTVRI
ncbi:MAG: bromoperoxidase, partial [Cyanobacteria bacterium J06555_12]